MPHDLRPGDVLAGRYRLVDLMSEARGGRFWSAHDDVLARHVAVHIIRSDDERAAELLSAARRSATLHDPRLLRVLDADTLDGTCFVVNEWGEGRSLDAMVLDQPLSPRRAAWIVAEVGQLIATAHSRGMTHGRLVPENVLVDEAGAVKVIGFGVDAALHGITDGTPEADVAGLAGVLYAALTGTWPGDLGSRVPPAPRQNGGPLRPRQVRAGIPRPLDTLCDQMLGHPDDEEGPASAQEMVDALVEFVGDTGVMAQEEATRQRDDNGSDRRRRFAAPPAAAVAAASPPKPESDADPGEQPAAAADPPPPADVPEAEEAGEQPADTSERPAAAADVEPTRTVDASGAEEPTQLVEAVPDDAHGAHDETQAGVPLFYENAEDVGWAPTERREPPPPPPPFEEHPERPLFAPDPPGGSAPRTPPEPSPTSTPGTGDHWFWASDTGTGPIAEEAPPEKPAPGRRWMQVAGALAVALVVLVVVVLAFNRGSDTGTPGVTGDPSPEPSTTTEAPAVQVVDVAGISDFDPFGDEGVENPEDAPAAIDGKPDTGWPTSTYQQDFGPGGLKPGVGLLLDLGQEQDVSEVQVTLGGAPTALEVRTAVGRPAPTELDGFEVMATGTAANPSLTLTAGEPVRARWVLVWLTSLPPTDGGFRGEVLEVVVRG